MNTGSAVWFKKSVHVIFVASFLTTETGGGEGEAAGHNFYMIIIVKSWLLPWSAFKLKVTWGLVQFVEVIRNHD